MPQTNQNKVGVWLPNSTSPVYSSFWTDGDRVPGTVADYNFSTGALYTESKAGFNWVGSRTITTPPGQSEAGGVFTWGPNAPMQDSTDEERFTFAPMSEFWFKMRFFIPANYFHRSILQIDIVGDISTWQVNDVILGTDSVKAGTLYGVSGQSIYLLFAQDSNSTVTWTGTITNQTRAQSRAGTRILEKTSNNKLLALWCNGYSGEGVSPSVVWITWPDGAGGSTLQYQYAADNTGSGQLGQDSSSPIVPFFSISDVGKWVNFIVHIKMATTPTATDGVIETWKRVDGEPSYTKTHTQTNAMIGERTGYGVFRNGYVHGWANSGFGESTQHYDSRVTLASATIDGVV